MAIAAFAALMSDGASFGCGVAVTDDWPVVGVGETVVDEGRGVDVEIVVDVGAAVGENGGLVGAIAAVGTGVSVRGGAIATATGEAVEPTGVPPHPANVSVITNVAEPIVHGTITVSPRVSAQPP